MKIECTIKRPGGSHIEIERDKYHFAPQEDGAHVAEVEKKTHIGILLAIREAYRIYDGVEVAPGDPFSPPVPLKTMNYTDGMSATGSGEIPPLSPDQQDSGIEALYGSSDHPASFDIGGKTYSLGDIVNMAFEASGLTLVEWNAQSDDTRASQIDEQLDALEGAGEDVSVEQKVKDAAERADLVDQYTAKFGKAPKTSMKNDTLRAKLAAGV